MSQATSSSCVTSFKDAYGGTGLRVADACDGDILAVPLHNCLVVLDRYKSPNEYRGRIVANYADILSGFQREWGLHLPEPIRAYICDVAVAKELRLASFVAWMQQHANAGRGCGWWLDWLDTLPKLPDVPLLRKASDAQIAWLSHVHPVLGHRARQDRSNWTSMCQRVITSSEHLWLRIPVLRPGTTAPWSHPLDDSCGRPDDTLQMPQRNSTCYDSRMPQYNSDSRDARLAHAEDLLDWAHMIVSSRSFCLSDRNGNRLICLVPLADFANHATEPNTSFVLSAAHCRRHCGLCPAHVLRSKRPLTSGEEVLLGYGSNKSNLLLLSCYGFCIPGNLADRLALGRPGAWEDHNEITKDLKFVNSDILKALSDLNPKFRQAVSGSDQHIDLSRLHQEMHMRRLLAAAVSVGEGLKWAAESPTCTPAHAEDADPEVLEHVGRLQQAQAVKRRLDALAQHCSQSLPTTVSTGSQLPEQWLSAVSEHLHLASCCRQILATLEQIWADSSGHPRQVEPL